MTGRVVIVTGASSGIGFEVARYLCEGGNDVVLACRNEEKANAAIQKIKNQNPNALATYMQLDFTSLESVHKFVEDFRATGKKLHVLVNNAGVALNFKDNKRQYTKDNFELTIGTNHFGPFLLTNLLLEDLKAAADGGDTRIVVVTSSAHDPEASRRRNRQVRALQPLDLDNLLLAKDGTYSGLQAYKNSKAANIMFTYELARRLEGSGVTVNCVCPGFVPGTDLARSSSGASRFFNRIILGNMLRFLKMTRTPHQAAQAICDIVTNEKYKETTGKYIKDGQEAKSSEETLDEEKQKKLWELSGGYVRLEGYEPIEVPPPPPEPKPEEKKEEKKEEGEAKTEEEKPAEEGEAKKEEEKPAEIEETKEETKTEEKKEEESKPEEKAEAPAEEKKDEAEEKKEEEKKAE